MSSGEHRLPWGGVGAIGEVRTGGILLVTNVLWKGGGRWDMEAWDVCSSVVFLGTIVKF